MQNNLKSTKRIVLIGKLLFDTSLNNQLKTILLLIFFFNDSHINWSKVFQKCIGKTFWRQNARLFISF